MFYLCDSIARVYFLCRLQNATLRDSQSIWRTKKSCWDFPIFQPFPFDAISGRDSKRCIRPRSRSKRWRSETFRKDTWICSNPDPRVGKPPSRGTTWKTNLFDGFVFDRNFWLKPRFEIGFVVETKLALDKAINVTVGFLPHQHLKMSEKIYQFLQKKKMPQF